MKKPLNGLKSTVIQAFSAVFLLVGATGLEPFVVRWNFNASKIFSCGFSYALISFLASSRV
jgi:hypothetical protein